MTRIIACVFGLVAALAVCVSAEEGPHVVEAAPRVMVFPFSAIGETGSYQWIGTGIEQSLLVEVNRPGSIAWSIPAAAPSTQPVTNPLAEATRSGATIAVFGSFQILNAQVRVTGQATDTGCGRVLAALTATGSIHDLFKVEDELDAQLQRALPQPPLNETVQELQATEPPAVVENDVQVVEPTYVAPDIYAVPYPYYNSDFGFYGPGIVFGGRGFYHHDFYGSHHFFPAPIVRPYAGGFGPGGITAGFGVGRGGGFGGGFHGGGFHGGGSGGLRR
jgi:TolB-like protein